MCILTRIYAHICNYFYNNIHLCLKLNGVHIDVSEFHLVAQFVLAFPDCLSITSHSNREKPGSHHPPSMYLFGQSQCTCTDVEPFTHRL